MSVVRLRHVFNGVTQYLDFYLINTTHDDGGVRARYPHQL